MRALVYTAGGNVRCVPVPDWVTVRASGGLPVCVECERCESEAEIATMTRGDAERTLGRFAQLHRRCADRSLFPGPRPGGWVLPRRRDGA